MEGENVACGVTEHEGEREEGPLVDHALGLPVEGEAYARMHAKNVMSCGQPCVEAAGVAVVESDAKRRGRGAGAGDGDERGSAWTNGEGEEGQRRTKHHAAEWPGAETMDTGGEVGEGGAAWAGVCGQLNETQTAWHLASGAAVGEEALVGDCAVPGNATWGETVTVVVKVEKMIGSDCGGCDDYDALACGMALQPGLSECGSVTEKGGGGETDEVRGAVEGATGTGASGEEGERGRLAGEGGCAEYGVRLVIPGVRGQGPHPGMFRTTPFPLVCDQ